MKIKISSKLRLFLVIIIAVLQTNATAQLLAVSGKKIINTSNNQEVILNAMNFGNWMVMEGYMMNSTSQATAQHIWKQKLTTLIGGANTTAFYDAWLANHVSQADILEVKKWGFNAVRLPLHYGKVKPIKQKPLTFGRNFLIVIKISRGSLDMI